jgi:twitching motility two-component system response regulator PilH
MDKLLALFGKSAPKPEPASRPKPQRAKEKTGGKEQRERKVVVELPERRKRERVDARPGTKALIIDDSATVVAALKKILKSAGYATLEAHDAESGLEIARSDHPDIIFLDIVLPGMNGFAALRALRRDVLTRDVPIIMISGNEQATEQFFGSRIGADDFMKKPFSRLEVFARIGRLLDDERVPRRRAEITGEGDDADEAVR